MAGNVKKQGTVRIRIPLTRTERDDVYAALNGESYLIRRGEDVEVPAGIAEILQHREEALGEILAFENAQADALAALEAR